jgi:hypothetical protein
MKNKTETNHSFGRQLTLDLPDPKENTNNRKQFECESVVNIDDYRTSKKDYQKTYNRLLNKARKLDW